MNGRALEGEVGDCAAGPGDGVLPPAHGLGLETSRGRCIIVDTSGRGTWLKLLFLAGKFVPAGSNPCGAGEPRVSNGGGAAEGE